MASTAAHASSILSFLFLFGCLGFIVFYPVFSHGHFFSLFFFSFRFRHIDMRLYAYTYLQLCMVAIWILCESQLVLFVLHPISELTCIIYLACCFHLINLTKPTSNGGSLKLLCLLAPTLCFVFLFLMLHALEFIWASGTCICVFFLWLGPGGMDHLHF